jgi:hypothetical protein
VAVTSVNNFFNSNSDDFPTNIECQEYATAILKDCAFLYSEAIGDKLEVRPIFLSIYFK